ncbi:hypothetical protein C7N43_02825 [Sphingobacteriales bacterium UPWRP_1]|nr:hypothetical protein C7N43_02825 [Sphingobacteriales bacterium UPWRP_1]
MGITNTNLLLLLQSSIQPVLRKLISGKLKTHTLCPTLYLLPSTFYPLPSTFYPLPSTLYPLPSTLYPLPSCRLPKIA